MAYIKKFSAVEDTQFLTKYNGVLKPITFSTLIEDCAIGDTYTKTKSNASQSEIIITEYIVNGDYFVPTLQHNDIDITFNRIEKLVKFDNLTNMFTVSPINLDGVAITSFNSILDDQLRVSNVLQAKYIKNIKYDSNVFGTIDNFYDTDLTADFGYILGQWITRGFIINKRQNKYNGCLAIPIPIEHLELFQQKLRKINNIPYLHNVKDDEEYVVLLNDDVNNFIKSEFSHKKSLPPFFYNVNSDFINGIIYGVFHTNGTITFNKQHSRAFLTIKLINYEFAKEFLNFLMVKFGVSGSFSKLENAKCCKISININAKIKDILENAFTYNYTTNANKLALCNELEHETVTITDIDKIHIKCKKSNCTTGYNMIVPNARASVLLNGITIPTIY